MDRTPTIQAVDTGMVYTVPMSYDMYVAYREARGIQSFAMQALYDQKHAPKDSTRYDIAVEYSGVSEHAARESRRTGHAL